jgi:ribosome-binding ATPase YchF (GTP1/OBG family)
VLVDLSGESRCRMVEPAIFKFLNERIAELTRQCESRENKAILEELSELTSIRDELKKVQQRTADRAEQLSRQQMKLTGSEFFLAKKLSYETQTCNLV